MHYPGYLVLAGLAPSLSDTFGKGIGVRNRAGASPAPTFFGWLLWVPYCAKILVWELNRTITPSTRKHPRY